MKKIRTYILYIYLSILFIGSSIIAGNFNPTLWTAASDDSIQEMQEALTKGADINSTNALGKSALFLAAEQGNSQAVQFLLSKGANPNQANNDNQTPADIALSNGNETIAQIITQAGGQVSRSNQNQNINNNQISTQDDNEPNVIETDRVTNTRIIDNDDIPVTAPGLLPPGYPAIGVATKDELRDPLEDRIRFGHNILNPEDPIDKNLLLKMQQQQPRFIPSPLSFPKQASYL